MRPHPIVSALLSGLLAAAPSRAADGADVPTTFVENCIHDETLELHAGHDSALLDDGDRSEVLAAMVSRYRQLAADGFAPTAILLWRSPAYGWLYLALKSHPTKPGKVCAMASFSASAFEFTGAFLRKYFVGART